MDIFKKIIIFPEKNYKFNLTENFHEFSLPLNIINMKRFVLSDVFTIEMKHHKENKKIRNLFKNVKIEESILI